ncbi:unnamed protein product [Rotaria socialis]|uniref:Uncharacterized protein n=1 Tax=Rotaria socialis TaxID=392032 RepID=A0A820TNZ6_9BILA|nr:unnamed protein product [Rotaria socialis]
MYNPQYPQLSYLNETIQHPPANITTTNEKYQANKATVQTNSQNYPSQRVSAHHFQSLHSHTSPPNQNSTLNYNNSTNQQHLHTYPYIIPLFPQQRIPTRDVHRKAKTDHVHFTPPSRTLSASTPSTAIDDSTSSTTTSSIITNNRSCTNTQTPYRTNNSYEPNEISTQARRYAETHYPFSPFIINFKQDVDEKLIINNKDINLLLEDIKVMYPEVVNLFRLSNKNKRPATIVRLHIIRIKVIDDLLSKKHIYINNIRYPISEYLVPVKVLVCTKCFQIGHIRSTCRSSTEFCRICGTAINDLKEHKDKCNNKPKCIKCAGEHDSNDHRCPNIKTFRVILTKSLLNSADQTARAHQMLAKHHHELQLLQYDVMFQREFVSQFISPLGQVLISIILVLVNQDIIKDKTILCTSVTALINKLTNDLPL